VDRQRDDRFAEGKRGESDMAEKMRKLERQLEEAREENNKRVSDTAQFQQMKKMMQTQSSKIRELRRRLERYEPDSIKEDDDP
jgi:predicted transcriptional regulator